METETNEKAALNAIAKTVCELRKQLLRSLEIDGHLTEELVRLIGFTVAQQRPCELDIKISAQGAPDGVRVEVASRRRKTPQESSTESNMH